MERRRPWRRRAGEIRKTEGISIVYPPLEGVPGIPNNIKYIISYQINKVINIL
jgi:hypothetical protein